MKSKKISKIKFELQTDNIEDHRYQSIDDWFDPREWTQQLWFKTFVGDIGNRKYNFLVLIHALVEQYLCYEHGISDEEVTKFDVSHTHCTNPGEHEEAPYHKEHMIANDVEVTVANALDVDWIKYEEAIDKTLRKRAKRNKNTRPLKA